MSRMNFVLGLATVAALAASGCSRGGNQPPPQTAQSYQETQQSHQTAMPSDQNKTCPMVVPGTEVAMAETNDGIALTFTTDSGDVNELRRRVYQAADQYRSQSSKLNQSPGGQQNLQQQQQNMGPGWNSGGPGGQGGFGPQGPDNGPGTTTPGDTSGQGGTSGDVSGSGTGGSVGGSVGGTGGSVGGSVGGSGGSGGTSGGTSGGASGSIGGTTGTSTSPQMGTSGGANTGSSSGPGGDYGDQGQQGMGQQQANAGSGSLTVAFNVYAQDIDRGARLVFTPRDPSQLDVLRSEIRQQASLMQPGQCPSQPISRR